ncbi:hypothetical protein F66182_5419 [Fusarium sp. NRRL 66182]|nr:hypothetical protein F66182_5419 [Fusarium sp. NRRL 66182]
MDSVYATNEPPGDSNKRKSPRSEDGIDTNPPVKRRVLTEARREQNRLAQKAYRQRQKQQRQLLKEAKARSSSISRLRPLLQRPVASKNDQDSTVSQRTTESHDQSFQEDDVDESFTQAESDANFADIYLNMLQFAPARLCTSLFYNARSLGFDLTRLADCGSEYISPFYQPHLSAASRPTSLAQAASAFVSSFDNSNVPVQLRPTMAQILIPHHVSLDLIPFPLMRERAIMLSAAMPHIFNNWELKLDIYVRGGLILWRQSSKQKSERDRNSYPPWEMKSWEAAPWFLEKWCMITGGEDGELYKQSMGWQVVREMICSSEDLDLTSQGGLKSWI